MPYRNKPNKGHPETKLTKDILLKLEKIKHRGTIGMVKEEAE